METLAAVSSYHCFVSDKADNLKDLSVWLKNNFLFQCIKLICMIVSYFCLTYLLGGDSLYDGTD